MLLNRTKLNWVTIAALDQLNEVPNSQGYVSTGTLYRPLTLNFLSNAG